MGGWSSPPSTGGGGSIAPLVVESANVVAQRNSTNAQISYVYGTYTDASNYSRVKITHAGGTTGANIATQGLGTGTAGPLLLSGDGATSLDLNSGNGVTLSYSSGTKLFVGSVQFQLYTNGNANQAMNLSYGWFQMNKNCLLQWSSVNDSAATGSGGDTGFARNAAGVVEINNGTAGTRRDLFARNVRTEATTVASLVAAATAGAGARSFVTDATSPTFGATVAGGGAVPTPVYSDGTNWKVG